MVYLWAILIYLTLLIGVGLYRSRRVSTKEDFVVAGRKLGAGVLIGTLLATWIGSGSIMASAGLAYNLGLGALWFDAGVWIALIILYFVAGRARRFAGFTVPDILEARYNKWARVLGTIVTVIAYTAIVSYQFKAGGKVLHLVTGLDEGTGIIITAAFVIGYTVLAGMISVAYTDVVNGIIMLIGLVIALPFLASAGGGWEQIVASLPDAHLQILGNLTWTEAVALALPTMLLLLGEAGMYQRFFSAKNAATARKAVVGWIIVTIFVETLIVVLAVVGRSLFPEIDGETVIIHSIKAALPTVIGCIALAAIVAVIVSTADSFLLVPATNLMRDVYQRFINPQVTDKQFLLYSRLCVVLLGLIAFAQLRFFGTILEMALYAYTMYGVGITPAVMGAFFWKRATPAGGVSAIAAGMSTTLIWEISGWAASTGWETVYPALAASVICLIVVSLLTPRPDPAKWQPFFD